MSVGPAPVGSCAMCFGPALVVDPLTGDRICAVHASLLGQATNETSWAEKYLDVWCRQPDQADAPTECLPWVEPPPPAPTGPRPLWWLHAIGAGDPDPDWGAEPLDLDESHPERPLWCGGPTAGRVKLWKATYDAVFVTTLAGDLHVVWRPMNRDQYRSLTRGAEQHPNEAEQEHQDRLDELIASYCMLHPKLDPSDFGAGPAGIASAVSRLVHVASGFVAEDTREL